MTDEAPVSDEERARLEVSLPTALARCRLRLASMIDSRQTFEIEMKGALLNTVHIPLFEVKRMPAPLDCGASAGVPSHNRDAR